MVVFAAVGFGYQFYAVVSGQTIAAAFLARGILKDRLQLVEGKGQRVADVYGGLVLRGAGHLVMK